MRKGWRELFIMPRPLLVGEDGGVKGSSSTVSSAAASKGSAILVVIRDPLPALYAHRLVARAVPRYRYFTEHCYFGDGGRGRLSFSSLFVLQGQLIICFCQHLAVIDGAVCELSQYFSSPTSSYSTATKLLSVSVHSYLKVLAIILQLSGRQSAHLE